MGVPFYCLMLRGGSLTDDIRDILFYAAQVMLAKQQRRRKIRADGMEGRVVTKYRYACIGGVAGVVFHAAVETDKGKHAVSYVVRPAPPAQLLNSPVVWEDIGLEELVRPTPAELN